MTLNTLYISIFFNVIRKMLGDVVVSDFQGCGRTTTTKKMIKKKFLHLFTHFFLLFTFQLVFWKDKTYRG